MPLNGLTKEEWAEHNFSVWNFHGANGYFASFDERIPETLVRYFTCKGDTVLDPFVGSGTTLVACARLGRRGLGFDCSEKAMAFAGKQIGENKGVEAKKGDARKLDLPAESVDFIVTSPPYFDIVTYSSDGEQIGNISDYSRFLAEIGKSFDEMSRVLKKGRFLAIVTADIRKAKAYFPLHVDYAKLLSERGFRLHQILINIFETSGKRKREECMGYPSNFHPWNVHEYILICQKRCY